MPKINANPLPEIRKNTFFFYVPGYVEVSIGENARFMLTKECKDLVAKNDTFRNCRLAAKILAYFDLFVRRVALALGLGQGHIQEIYI